MNQDTKATVIVVPTAIVKKIIENIMIRTTKIILVKQNYVLNLEDIILPYTEIVYVMTATAI